MARREGRRETRKRFRLQLLRWLLARLCPSAFPRPGVNMSGLNKIELEGCRDLLGLMETSEILALCDTITNRLVQPQDRQDAIRAVLAYSQSAEELLKRKKVYREIIFKYLAMKGVIVPPASEKHNLIQYAKNHWNKPELKVMEETLEKVPNTEDIILCEQVKMTFIFLKFLYNLKMME
uniref:Chromosome 3 open reading frame 38 n=1 Tax=Sarcophilus harrisii TaxID=9305 RepID=A0A7N4PVY8_SARHA